MATLFAAGRIPPRTMPMTRADDYATSHDAAERVRPHVTPLQRAVLLAVRAAGVAGLTDRELEQLGAFARCAPSTVRKRRSELAHAGLLTAAGVRDKLTVWVLAAEAPLPEGLPEGSLPEGSLSEGSLSDDPPATPPPAAATSTPKPVASLHDKAVYLRHLLRETQAMLDDLTLQLQAIERAIPQTAIPQTAIPQTADDQPAVA